MGLVNLDEEQIWNGLAGIAAVGAAAASKPVVERVWRLLTGREAPGDPAHQDVTWGEAIMWALLTGALLGLIRLLAQRAAASAWAKAKGEYPASLRTTRP